VPDQTLAVLYRLASVFVFPSLYEGFGFPPLEAMASGVPTVASRSSALAENLEGAAELVPGGAPDVLAAAMRRLLNDDGERARVRALGLARAARFRWRETAERLHACYEGPAGEPPGALSARDTG
jgi:glycosyltransferase involved in cell wall biosynthesis